MNYYSYENQKALTELSIKAKEKALSLHDDIIKCLSKFDGKQINKRIDTALKKIDENLRFNTQYNSFIIEMYIEDRCINRKDTSGCMYLKDSSYSILHSSLSSSYGDGVQNDDLSFNYENCKARLLSNKQYLTEYIKQAKKDLKNVDKIIAKFNKLKEDQSKLIEDTSYTLREYFNIKF